VITVADAQLRDLQQEGIRIVHDAAAKILVLVEF
jgi:hypothetical protein